MARCGLKDSRIVLSLITETPLRLLKILNFLVQTAKKDPDGNFFAV
jgi:hypothetical protein